MQDKAFDLIRSRKLIETVTGGFSQLGHEAARFHIFRIMVKRVFQAELRPCGVGLGPEMEATDQSATNQSAIKLTFKTSSGMFKSSVMNSETGKPIAVNGIVLQNQNFGAGFFLGTTESGSVLLSPTQ